MMYLYIVSSNTLNTVPAVRLTNKKGVSSTPTLQSPLPRTDGSGDRFFLFLQPLQIFIQPTTIVYFCVQDGVAFRGKVLSSFLGRSPFSNNHLELFSCVGTRSGTLKKCSAKRYSELKENNSF